MIRELEIVRPFLMGNYRFTDLRTETESVRQRVITAQQEAIFTYPHDLFCRGSTARRVDRVALSRAKTEEARTRIQRRIDTLNEDGVRRDIEEYLGDIRPVNFVLRRKDKFFGVWQIFGIKILRENPRGIQVGAGWFPVFPRGATNQQIARFTLDINIQFLDTLMPLEGGRTLDVHRWEVPVINDGTRSKELEVVSLVFAQLADRSEFTVERSPVPGQPGRETLRMSRSEAPRQTHSDPFDPSLGGD